MRVTIEKTRNNHYTAKVKYNDAAQQREREIYLCSKYDPIKEAHTWVDEIYNEATNTFIVYGLGMGYHIEALSQRLDRHQKIYVIEANQSIYEQVKPYIQWLEAGLPQTKLYCTSNMKEIMEYLEHWLVDGEELYGNKEVLLHLPSIHVIPSELMKLREMLEVCVLRTQKKSRTINERIQIQENYEQNELLGCPNVAELFDSCKGKSIVIVSGGPSLQKNLHWLKQINENLIVLATGRVLKTLVNEGIRVDYFCIIDAFNQWTSTQIEGVEDLKVPFVFLNTANYQTVKMYHGPKYIAYSMDYPQTQPGRVASGGSVATAAMDLGIKLGADNIIFIGQDLAYTDGITHIRSAGAGAVKNIDTMKKVKDVNGNYVATTSGFISMKYWIEQKIKDHPEIRFLNCTEGGAFIEGCHHMKLVDALHEYKLINIYIGEDNDKEVEHANK